MDNISSLNFFYLFYMETSTVKKNLKQIAIINSCQEVGGDGHGDKRRQKE